MSTATLPSSLLLDPERHPLRSPEWLAELGTVVVVAPHPDDESLGCGGLLALLAAAGQPAHVFFVTDGSKSHPHSRSFPAAELAALRETEALSALAALGLPATRAQFLRFRDCGLPASGTPEFAAASTGIGALLEALAPDTLFIPWRRDPHCDHEGTWSVLRAAAATLEKKPRWVEYPVWAWPRAETPIAPQAADGAAWRLDITTVLSRKAAAIAQHRSQLGEIIEDDPEGFVLQPAMLAHFAHPWELFIDPADV